MRAAISLYNVASPIRPSKPREMLRTIALTGFAALMAAMTISLAPPAQAQIGNIFSDPPLRPPGNIPRGNQQQQQQFDDEEEVPQLPQGRLLPTPNRPPPQQQGLAPPGPVQSQPLAPPPGTTVIPQNTAPGIAVAPPQPSQVNPLPGLPPGQRQPKSVPGAAATLQPGDEVVSEPPAQKIVNKKATFSGLDKITGRIINFDEDIGETVQFGALRVKTSACYTRPADRGRQHRRLCRGRRDHAARRGEADLFGLDVCGEPRPARRRASDLRHLADRLQRPGDHRRQCAARTAETAAAGRQTPAGPQAGRPASATAAVAAAAEFPDVSVVRQTTPVPQ